MDEPSFKRLAHEVAFTEYAIAVAQASASAGCYRELTDPLVEARERIDSIARHAAGLFAPTGSAAR